MLANIQRSGLSHLFWSKYKLIPYFWNTRKQRKLEVVKYAGALKDLYSVMFVATLYMIMK